MFNRAQWLVLSLGLAVFASLAAARALSGSGAGTGHERFADIASTFLDFKFSGRVDVAENPLACLYRIPVLTIKRVIRPAPFTREIYVDQLRVSAFAGPDRGQSLVQRYPLVVSFPSPDAAVERQVGPIEFAIPKLALPRSSSVGLALIGTEILRAHVPPLPEVTRRRAMWPMVARQNLTGHVISVPDAPGVIFKVVDPDDWKTPSDPDDACSSIRIH